jgi:hypothetical protein
VRPGLKSCFCEMLFLLFYNDIRVSFRVTLEMATSPVHSWFVAEGGGCERSNWDKQRKGSDSIVTQGRISK